MSIKYFLFWLPMIVLAFVNATLRQLYFIKHYSELAAHQLSTITLIVLCSIYVAFIFPYLTVQSYKQAFLIGFEWVILTVLFESSLGRLTGKTWPYLLKDYDVVAGHIWPVFLISLLLLPYIFFGINGRH